jgi:hypothetical protein
MANLCGSPPADAGPPLPWARANAVYARALATLEDMFAQSGVLERDQEFQRAFIGQLDRLLNALGEDNAAQVRRAEQVARTEGHSLAGKIVAIALDRRRRPGLYDAVEREYGSVLTGIRPDGGGRRAGPGNQHIKKEYIDAKYRLVWEFRLLTAPAADERPFMREALPPGFEAEIPGIQMPPTPEALMRIGSEDSIISFVFFFRHACRDEQASIRTGVGLDDVLTALERHPSPKAMKAVLDCAEWCEVNKGLYLPRGLKRESPPSEWVNDLVSEKRPDGDRWRRALAELPEDGLTQRQQNLVRLAKKVVGATSR